MKKAINGIIVSIIYLAAFILMLIGILSYASDKTPSIFNRYFLVVQSDSMVPTLQVGDIVIVEPSNQYSTDDVISFRININNMDVIVTHRIYDIITYNGEQTYITKGDNVYISNPDDWILTKEDILGIVKYKIPLLGWIYNYIIIQGHLYLLFVPLISSFIYLAYKQIVKMYKLTKEDINKNGK
ncbi:MAG: signal peptidase I [Bacilli bacterium]|nr:signal peptidase I [Bacilli bacterium]